jgi:cytidylate kinase
MQELPTSSAEEISEGLAALRSLQPAIIAIDGPAAAGKSTIGYQLAQKVNYLYFDTGIMYRAVTYAALARGLDLHDAAAIGALAQSIQIDITPTPPEEAHERLVNVLVDQVDVSAHLRTGEVDRNVSLVSAYPAVREALSQQQRRIAHHYGRGAAERPGIVMVGRDIGTVICPEAPAKLYVTATPEVRAGRRWKQLTGQGEAVAYDDILADMPPEDRAKGEAAARKWIGNNVK